MRVQAHRLQLIQLMQRNLKLDLLLVILGVAERLDAADEAVFFVPLRNIFQHPVIIVVFALSNLGHGGIQFQGALSANGVAMGTHRARQGV